MDQIIRLDPKTVAAAGSGLAAITAAVYVADKVRQNYKESCRIKNAIDIRREERISDLLMMSEEYKLEAAHLEILKLPFEELVEKLQSRSLTSVEVLRAFIGKALAEGSHYNGISEFVPNAVERAENLDKLSSVQGPLHGIPICIKDDHDIAGMDTTLGLGKNLNNPAETHSVLVQTLMSLGAVPFFKTNVPQALYSYASGNPIYGETTNIRDKDLSAGGSSCGTAALVAAGGAHFGIASDLDGSLIISAHFSELCTLVPTLNRLSFKGIRGAIPNRVGFKGVSGILAKETKTLTSVFRTLTLDNLQNSFDSQAVPITWNDSLFKSDKPLRIGYFSSLSFFPSVGDTSRVVYSACNKLHQLGHTVQEFKIENDWEIMKLLNDVISADFGCHSVLHKQFDNEPHVKGLEEIRASCGQPDWVRRISRYFNPITWPWSSSYSARGSFLSRGSLDQNKDKDVWELMKRRNELISKILGDMEGLDLLIGPAFPFPACALDDAGKLYGAALYTMLWNFVDFPTGAIPFGTESGGYVEDYDDQGDSLLKLAKQNTRNSVGSPIAVQLIAKPYKEELVLRLLMELSGSKS